MNNKPTVILFDVNETLLDMLPLKQNINALLKNESGFQIWFNMLLQYSLVDNCVQQYHDFSTIGNATLQMAAQALNVSTTETERKNALAVMQELKAHPDVEQALKLLQQKGFRLATLTNSPPNVQANQLKTANLTTFFEQTLSIDSIKTYKPSIESYHWAAQQLSAAPNEILMVAAHGWDIAGAIRAGLQTAFIAREGKSLYPLAPKPDFKGNNLMEIAEMLLA